MTASQTLCQVVPISGPVVEPGGEQIMPRQGRPILVVDDDPTLRDVLVLALLRSGYPVREAADGSQALNLIEKSHPCLVVLDMQLPKLDRRGLAQELKARSLHPPVLAMTAGPDAALSAQEVGAADSLQKPFGIADLLAKIEALRSA